MIFIISTGVIGLDIRGVSGKNLRFLLQHDKKKQRFSFFDNKKIIIKYMEIFFLNLEFLS